MGEYRKNLSRNRHLEGREQLVELTIVKVDIVWIHPEPFSHSTSKDKFILLLLFDFFDLSFSYLIPLRSGSSSSRKGGLGTLRVDLFVVLPSLATQPPGEFLPDEDLIGPYLRVQGVNPPRPYIRMRVNSVVEFTG